MRILYGIQCTGNGHIKRSVALINELRKHVRVDVLTSGANAHADLPIEVAYRLHGLCYFFGKNGSFDFWKTLTNNNLSRFFKEIKTIPLYKYDMVISDFEPVTAWAAKRNWVYSAGVSNQATLLKKDYAKPTMISPLSKFILRNLCPVDISYSLSYQKLGNGYFHPPVSEDIKVLSPFDGGYYVVYLPFYSKERIVKHLSQFSSVHWKVFSKDAAKQEVYGNINVNPISNELFNKALEGCTGVLCSAGFGLTSEALYLKKKLMVIPMKNQYEQHCNAFTLQQIGVTVIKSLKKKHYTAINQWLSDTKVISIQLNDEKNHLVQTILTDYVDYVNNQAV